MHDVKNGTIFLKNYPQNMTRQVMLSRGNMRTYTQFVDNLCITF